MTDEENLLISVHPHYVDAMLAGRKTVELRRKPVSIAHGSRVWIYTTLPRGAIEAVALVSEVYSGSLTAVWKRFGQSCAISKQDFDSYFIGVERAHAIVFSSVDKLSRPLKLGEIRREVSGFHPPQFFKRLSENGPELGLFRLAFRPQAA